METEYMVNKFLQEKDEEGILFSYNVAILMQREAIRSGFSLEKARDMFVLGLLHDVGKYYCTDGENIHRLSGKILRNMNFQYWREAYACMSISEYQSEELRLLNKVLLLINE